MKKLSTILFLLFLNMTCFAQNCNEYFSFTKGMKIEMVSYDKKDKLAATIKYEIVDYKPAGSGMTLVMSTATYDAKGALLAKGDASGKCENGVYYADVRNISSDMIPKAADVQVDITGEQLTYPTGLKVGDKLKDATINVASSMGSMKLMSMAVNIVNREVAAMETVETPAGKFDCLKITYTLNMKFMGNRTMNGVEYLAKGIGVVKSENYDSKGKKQSSMILNKLEK